MSKLYSPPAIEIEKDIPPLLTEDEKFPLQEMRVGDSMFFPFWIGSCQTLVESLIRKCVAEHRGWVFQQAFVKEGCSRGIRIWRTR